jgi:hypothetical protein
MTEENLTGQADRNAWLVCLGDRASFDGFSAIVDGSDAAGVREGDGIVCLLSADGGVSAFGRVYRVRTDVDGATIYTDAVLVLESPVDAAAHGITAPADGSPLTRLDWPTFESALKSTIGIGFDEIPTVTGESQAEQAYLRELLQVAVEDDLLGPACGPEETILGMSVRDRYLVGKLAPKEEALVENIEGLQGSTAIEESEDGGAAADELTPHEGQRHEPGEEFASTSGTHDPDSDDRAEVDASKNQSLVPSSMGITVCVDGDVDSLEVEICWGRYCRRPDLDEEEEYERKDDAGRTEKAVKRHAAWKRTPSGGKTTLQLKEGTVAPTAVDPECPQVLLQGLVRPPLDSGDRLVTLFLINDQPKPEQNQDEAWLFQPEIIVRHAEGAPIFRRRPVLDDDGHDPERVWLEMIYRKRVEFAVGHSVSVHATPEKEDPEKAIEVRTTVLPQYDVAITETPGLNPEDRPAMQRLVDEGLLDMRKLAQMPRDELVDALSILTDDYEAWIVEQHGRVGADVTGYDSAAGEAKDRCDEVLKRLREGIEALRADDDALKSFQFANEAMATQRVRSIYSMSRRRGQDVDLAAIDVPKSHSWRPFQLAFILLSIPALADPRHRDRTSPIEAYADLLWFPTGGGKTEAYLGVAAFTMAIRRIQRDDSNQPLAGLDSSRGLAVIMRYTLRLLTLQQFQRASTLMCAMEAIRRQDEDTWGQVPFTLGLWVGMKVTPNTTEQSHAAIEAIRTKQRPRGSSPAQLTFCPWCGTEILPGRDIEVRRVGSSTGRTILFCGDALGRCEFSKAKAPDDGLPVLVVDDEIYRRPPSMLIATVDKFAQMAWRGQVRTLFGRATEECPRHGLLWPGSDCNGRHNRRGALPAVQVQKVRPMRPPDLIIQDEFHLISGPLGTMVGLYETAVDELATWKLGEDAIHPKVIASTATVRKAEEQVNNVFLRRVSVFPPHGLDVEDNFFSVQRPLSERPGRRYMGICSPGSARPAVLIRVYTALLTAAQALFERFGPAADPWMTAVGYFNSLRELGGMRRLAEDDVQTRSFRVQMSKVARPGLAQRSVRNVDELTSRVSSKDIPKKLDQLEVSFKGVRDSATGLFKAQWAKGETQAIDVVLATNMLSVGVDVNRLGLMAVNGQPKSTAEYIQATSRVGRAFPGLVCTVLTWSRPRDLSHYETFEHYHATFYKHVEAQSVTPFAPRALDRGLTGAMVSWLRLDLGEYNPNLGAQTMDSVTRPEVAEAQSVLSKRGHLVTNLEPVRDLAAAMVAERCDEWIAEATRGGRRLGYEPGRARAAGEGDIAGLLRKPGLKAWDHFTVPMSLREVEPGVRLIMATDSLPPGPDWKAAPAKKKDGGDK